MERECSIEQSGYSIYRFKVSSRDCTLQQESDDATDVNDHLIEASASDVDEGCLREARNTVMVR